MENLASSGAIEPEVDLPATPSRWPDVSVSQVQQIRKPTILVVTLKSLCLNYRLNGDFMSLSYHSWIYVDGSYIEVVISKKGLTFDASGLYRGRHLTGKGRTESEAKSRWKALAEYEANS